MNMSFLNISANEYKFSNNSLIQGKSGSVAKRDQNASFIMQRARTIKRSIFSHAASAHSAKSKDNNFIKSMETLPMEPDNPNLWPTPRGILDYNKSEELQQDKLQKWLDSKLFNYFDKNGPFKLDENKSLHYQDFLRIYDLVESACRCVLLNIREANENTRN